jgi:hypothetical protein
MEEGAGELILIARLTSAGKFHRAGKGKNGVGAIGKLEEMLIGTYLSKNSKLLNKNATNHLIEI